MTKKLWGIVLCMSLVLTMLCSMPAAATDSYSDWTVTNGTVKTENPSPAGGNYVELAADKASGTTGVMKMEYFDVTPGKLNVVSFYYKSNKDGLAQLTMYERAEDNSSKGAYTVRLASTGDEWEKCSYGFVPTTGVKITLQLEAYSYYADTAKIVCYDDIMVEAKDDGVLTIPAGEMGYYGAIGGLASKDEKIAVSGRIKAEAADTAKMMVQVDSAVGEASMGSKSLTDQWQNFSVSGITYLAKGTALKVVAGTSALSLQDVKFEKDANLLPEASMEDTSKIGWSSSATWTKSGTIDGLYSPTTANIEANKPVDTDNVAGYKTDGDCPDGSGYLYMGEGTKGYIYTSSPQGIATDGTRYLISFWYKTNSDQAGARIQQRLSSTYYNSPDLLLADTQGTWKKAEFVAEKITSGDRFYIQLGNFTTSAFGEDEYLACDLVSMIPLEDSTALGLYSVSGTAGDGSDVKYGNYLGDRIEKLDGTVTQVSAVYPDSTLSSTGTTVSSKAVVIAAYTKDQSGAKQLTGVSFSTVDAGATTVQYPTARLNTADFAEGTEFRAFLWDSISGLKPLEASITVTK